MFKTFICFIFVNSLLGGLVLSFVKIENNTVKYKISPDFTPREKEYIQEKMAHIQSKTCLNFKELGQDSSQTEDSYIDIIFREEPHGCQSIGLYTPVPKAILPPHCFSDHWVVHELLHTIGWLEHEHQREDRDCYVEIHFSKLRDHNYEKHVPSDTKFPYDVGSVMHYRRGSYLTEAEHVVDRGSRFGSEDVLTEMDVWKLNYKFCNGPLYCDTHKDECDRINATNFPKGCLPKKVWLP